MNAMPILKSLRIAPRRVRRLAAGPDFAPGATILTPSQRAATPLTALLPRGRVLVTRAQGPLRIFIAPGAAAPATIAWPQPPGRSEGFTIRADAGGMALVAADPVGLRWAVQTAAEILELAGPRFGGFKLSDWPQLALRGVMVDLSRTSIEKPAYIRRLIDLLAGWRCNMLQLYFEERLNLTRHPALAHPLGYSPRQVAELVRYAATRGIELAPALATFGHAQGFLHVPQYRDLADGEQIYQFDPLNPRVGELLEDMIADWSAIAPRGAWFNACCDEAPYYGNNARTRDFIARHGADRFIARHLNNLYAMLARRGLRMMIWADMLKHHPAVLRLIPRDIVLIEWNYDKVTEATERAIENFLAEGFEVVAAPAASRSAQIAAPRRGQITENIPAFTALANRMGLAGVLCCQWECLTRSPRLSEPGYALACRMAWQGSTGASAAQRRQISQRLTGLDGRGVDELMAQLAPDRMLKRFRRVHWRPDRPKTYHLSTHELIAGDPAVYLRPGGASPWARGLTAQYERADATLKTLLAGDAAQAGDWPAVLRFACDCALFAGWKRSRINAAGALFRQAAGAWRRGEIASAADSLAAAAAPLSDLADLSERLDRQAPAAWSLDRYENDPTYAWAYGRRFTAAAEGCRCLIDEAAACARSIRDGGPFTLAAAIAARRALIFRIHLREVGEVNIVALNVSLSTARVAADESVPAARDAYRWSFDRMIQAFQPPSSRYDYPWIPPGGLPAAIEVRLTRTQAPWRLDTDLEIAVARPVAPTENPRALNPQALINDEDFLLINVPGVRYRLDRCEGDAAVFVLEKTVFLREAEGDYCKGSS